MDQEELLAYLAFIVSLFALTNPLAAVPIFLSLTGGMSKEMRQRLPIKTAIAAFIILTIAFIAGETILEFFSVSLAALRIAGGVVILAMGWSMLQAKTSRTQQTQEEVEEATVRESIAIIPMAIPVTAGPGAISLMVVMATYDNPIEGKIAIIIAILFICILLWLFLWGAASIARVLGQTGLNVVTRLMGLLMLGVGIEFITRGIGDKFPGLLGIMQNAS